MAPRRDFRQTKIVCTLGPASSTPEQIEQLAAAGMNIARLNMSHGDHASHLQVIQVVQKLNERLNHPIALLLDLQGPAIRTGDRPGHLSLEVGQEFHVTVGPTENPEERTIHVDYRQAGDRGDSPAGIDDRQPDADPGHHQQRLLERHPGAHDRVSRGLAMRPRGTDGLPKPPRAPAAPATGSLRALSHDHRS